MLGFVHISKTGGSTMKFILRNTFGVRHCDLRPSHGSDRASPEDLSLARLLHPGLRSVSGHNLIHPTLDLDGIRFFTLLRDPVHRVASAYAHHARGARRRRKGQRLQTLAEFVDRAPPGGKQTWQIAGCADPDRAYALLRDRYFFVGLTERFDESLATLSALSHRPLDTRYERRNVAPPGDPVKEAVLSDPESRATIERANGADRALYDRVAAELFPALLREAKARAGAAFGARGELPRVVTARFLAGRAWEHGLCRCVRRWRRLLDGAPHPAHATPNRR